MYLKIVQPVELGEVIAELQLHQVCLDKKQGYKNAPLKVGKKTMIEADIIFQCFWPSN